MDSKPEKYGEALQDIPFAHQERAAEEIDFDELVRNRGGFFDVGEDVAAAKAEKPIRAFNRKMWDAMTPAYLTGENRELLQTMTGDFTQIELLMETVAEDEDGVVKKVTLKPGTGRKLEAGDLATIHYIMACEGEESDEPFDSTYTGLCRPRRYRVGGGEGIKLLEYALLTLRVGEEAKFLGSPGVCFGKLGIPFQGIKGDARVMMQIQVVEVVSTKEEMEVLSMSEAERRSLTFSQLFDVAVQLKHKGNREYQQDHCEEANIFYHELDEFLQTVEPQTPEETSQARNLTWQLLNNMCLNYIKMEELKKAFECAEKGSKIPGLANIQKGKPFYLCAKTKFQLGETEEAYEYIRKAVSFSCGQELKDLKSKIEEKRMALVTLEKERCKRMLGGGGGANAQAQTTSRQEETEEDGTAAAIAVGKMMNELNLQK